MNSSSSQPVNGRNGTSNGNVNSSNNNGSLFTNGAFNIGTSQPSGLSFDPFGLDNFRASLSHSAPGAGAAMALGASSPAANQPSQLSQLSHSQQSVNSTSSNGSNSSRRPVFNNPLDSWRSPSPPAKRQKTGPGGAAPGRVGGGSNSFPSSSSSSTAAAFASGPSGSFRKNTEYVARKTPSSSQPPSRMSPQLSQASSLASPITWSPRRISHSQPAPRASPVPTPVRPPAPPRRVSKPVKVTETQENNRVVFIIDDDDDDDDAASSSTVTAGPAKSVPSKPTPTSTPTPTPTPRLTPVPVPRLPPMATPRSVASTQPPKPHSQPQPRPYGPTSHIPDSMFRKTSLSAHFPSVPQGQTPSRQGTAGPQVAAAPQVTPVAPPQRPRLGGSSASEVQPPPRTETPIKPPPVDDFIRRSNIRGIPPAPRAVSASPAVSTTPVPVPQPYIRPPATPTGPKASAPPVPINAVSPVVHTNEARPAAKPAKEHLDTPVIIDITPTKASTPVSTKKTTQEQQDEYFVRYANLARRPYLQSSHRAFVAQNYHNLPTLLGMPPRLRNVPRHLLGGIPRNALTTLSTPSSSSPSPSMVIHVDFLPDEKQHILDVVRFVQENAGVGRSSKRGSAQKHSAIERELKSLLRRQPPDFEQFVVKSVTSSRLPGRNEADIAAFLVDARTGKINIDDNANSTGGKSGKSSPGLGGPTALTLARHRRADYSLRETQATRSAKLNALIMAREVVGQRPVQGRSRQLLNFTNAVRTLREDSLRLRNEWTNLSSDVITISWTSEDSFICGTTTHMDDRNHQYNRQGNVALGSVTAGTLRAYPDHRIERRLVTAGSNSSENANTNAAAQAFDDPWLYTSVVSSDYDSKHGLAFTSGFDKTVQVWYVNKDGGTMTHQRTWKHEGKVNFVVASSASNECLIATAADVPVNAVRVYRMPSLQERMRGIRQVTYKSLSCSRIVDLEGKPVLTDKWAYLPAAIRWGLSETTRHMLLVGYSPRGLDLNAEDHDIPEDRRNSGELCLWNGSTGERWRILGATSQNVFEVAWHPTQACFAAATASVNTNLVTESHIHTQIRIFRQSGADSEFGGRSYSEVQKLDCYADDINELALRPNSFGFLYIAAGCTNGHTYVWDTSAGDHHIHDLGHGPCIEELSGERISTEDTGVKFVAWGDTPDRLYTGSSDGIVKVWNIRTHSASDFSPFVRNLLECAAPVSFGAFSPNKSRLAVGDASGRVFILSVEDAMETDDEDGAFLSEDEDEEDIKQKKINTTSVPDFLRSRSQQAVKHHVAEVIHHSMPPPPTPPAPQISPEQLLLQSPTSTSTAPSLFSVAVPTAPDGNNLESEYPGIAQSRAFLASGELIVNPDPTIGVVKGPNYADTNLFRLEFHQDRDPRLPLLAEFDRLQQENRPRASTSPSRQRALRSVYPDVAPSTSFRSLPLSGLPGAGTVDLGAPDPLQSLQRQNAVRRVQMLHTANSARDLDVSTLPNDTRAALELADRAALLHIDDDYGFDYEEVPDNI